MLGKSDSISRLKKSRMTLERAVERMESLREEKSKAITERLYLAQKKFELKAKKLQALDVARKREMNVIFDVKFELAALLRKMIHLKAKNERMKKVSVKSEIQLLNFLLHFIDNFYFHRSPNWQQKNMCNEKNQKLRQIISSIHVKKSQTTIF